MASPSLEDPGIATACSSSTYWKDNFPEWNSKNLETLGVREVPGKSYVLVLDRHPVVSVLKCNASLIGCNVAIVPMVDEHWYKVSKGVLEAVCYTLRGKVCNV